MENFENGYALLIGVGTDDIKQTANDAKKIGDIITKNDPSITFPKNFVGYPSDQVVVLTKDDPVQVEGIEKEVRGATKEGIVTCMNWLAKNADMQSAVIVYYAGHGIDPKISNEKDGDEFYLKPYDHDVTKQETYLYKYEFINLLQNIRSKKLMVFMGSCYSAAFSYLGKEQKIDKEKMFLKEGEIVQAMDGGKGKVFLASSHASEESLIRRQENYTIFGQTVIEALQGQASREDDLFVCCQDVIKHVLKKVPENLEGSFLDQKPNWSGQDAELINIIPNIRYFKNVFELTEVEKKQIKSTVQTIESSLIRLIDIENQLQLGNRLLSQITFNKMDEIQETIIAQLKWLNNFKGVATKEEFKIQKELITQTIWERIEDLFEEKGDLQMHAIAQDQDASKMTSFMDNRINRLNSFYESVKLMN